jgi:hypothetical protein
MGSGFSGAVVPAIPLPISELEKFERGESFSAGNATFIPNQIDPDARRLGSFLTGALSFQHAVSRDTSYRVNFQRVDTRRTLLDAPGGPGSFEPSGDSNSQYNGYINTFQGQFSQRFGEYNQISAGYEFEDEKYYQFDGYNVSGSAVDLRQNSHAFKSR